MKKEELPQDRSALQGYTRELHYVKNEEGKFTTGLSSGWEIKASALENAWEDVHQQMAESGTQGAKTGIRLTVELVDQIKNQVQGVYLMPAFSRFDHAAEIIEKIRGNS